MQRKQPLRLTTNGLHGSLFLIASGLIIQISCPGVRSDPELRGVIPNSFDHIFTHISRTHDQQFLIRASYLEIYQVISFNHFHYLFPIILIARFFPSSQLAITCSKLTWRHSSVFIVNFEHI